MLAQKINVKKSPLILNVFLIRTGPLVPEYHWIEINITFHLINNTMLYSFWSLSYKGKIRTTPAPVLSILKTQKCLLLPCIEHHAGT